MERMVGQEKPSQGSKAVGVEVQGAFFPAALLMLGKEALDPALQIHEFDPRPRQLT